MAFARVQVELIHDTLLPEDRTVNVFHFRTPGTVADAATDITANLDAFYTAFQSSLSVALTGNGDVKFYDLEDDKPRAPVAETTVSFTPGTLSLPGEVAACLSFQGPTVSGMPQARRRGRIFIGPLSSAASTYSLNDTRPTSSFRTAVAGAAAALMTDSSLPGLIWSVFSPTTAGPEPWTSEVLGEAFVTITNGWIDDAFDTVRSRGLAPTTRSAFP